LHSTGCNETKVFATPLLMVFVPKGLSNSVGCIPDMELKNTKMGEFQRHAIHTEYDHVIVISLIGSVGEGTDYSAKGFRKKEMRSFPPLKWLHLYTKKSSSLTRFVVPRILAPISNCRSYYEYRNNTPCCKFGHW
jgi:hypothetical protein